MVRVGINGFGRMGRLALRVLMDIPDLEVVLINEIKGGIEAGAHLFTFDSVYGRWKGTAEAKDQSLIINGHPIAWTERPTIDQVPWEAHQVAIVLECTGKFLTEDVLKVYLQHGVRKVIVSAPVKQGALNVVMGVNDVAYRPDEHHILTAASCTTNSLAPVVKVIHEKIGIRHAMITTVHNVTNTQTVVDSAHKDLRRARSSLLSLVPTTTGSATAITLIYPELKGRINGHAVRVPLLNSSLTDAVFEVSRPTTVEEVNQLLMEAASTYLEGILGVEDRPLVSSDYRGDNRSAIVDTLSTMVVDGTQVKVFAWYDNEWGYVNRMVDLALKVASNLQ